MEDRQLHPQESGLVFGLEELLRAVGDDGDLQVGGQGQSNRYPDVEFQWDLPYSGDSSCSGDSSYSEDSLGRLVR